MFAVLPTGFSKSLCYTCRPGVFDALHYSTGSVAIVITPLTAIIWFLACARARARVLMRFIIFVGNCYVTITFDGR